MEFREVSADFCTFFFSDGLIGLNTPCPVLYTFESDACRAFDALFRPWCCYRTADCVDFDCWLLPLETPVFLEGGTSP